MPKVIADNGVSSGARHLFQALKDRARGKSWPECWPSKSLLADDVRKSVRMVQYYLQELEIAGIISIIRGKRNKNRYRILLALNERIGNRVKVAPLQSIAEVALQSIAEQPLQSIAEVELCSIMIEATNTASSAGTEAPAAAADEKVSEEDMTKITQSMFDELVKLGMPRTEEMAKKCALDPDLARDVFRSCKKRFSKGKKPVDNPGGFIVAFLRDPSKFGFVQKEGRWHDPDCPSGLTADEQKERESVRKAANEKDRARRQADADKAYADMADTWERLPEGAKQEIRDVVLKQSPLFHGSGADTPEFELQCMREAFSFKRHAWRKKHMATMKEKTAG